MKIRCVVIAASLLLSACVSQPHSANTAPNWLTIGERAAQRGEMLIDQQTLAERYELDVLSSESFTLYQQGHREGLNKFCEINNAFKFGIKGGNYKGQCEGIIVNETQFKYEWSKAYQQFMFPDGPK